jgi:phosphomannomutase
MLMSTTCTSTPHTIDSLRDRLDHEPRDLKFGTSGRRGEVIHLTQLEVYINALAELEYLQSIPIDAGGIHKGDVFYYARDLRPSSCQFVASQGGRGEMAQAIERAIYDAGMQPVNLGCIPTPALTFHALSQGKGSIMVTGSHIPFDRNGYKTNSAKGELMKTDEAPINQRVASVRQRLYNDPLAVSLFDTSGMFKAGHRELLPENGSARTSYWNRYAEFFAGRSLQGMRLLVYQHSAVGRDLLLELLAHFGAQVIPAGRSDTFVPIDTENIDAEQLSLIQTLVEESASHHGRIDAVVSTDGDSDRPLLLGVDTPPGQPGRARFMGGDLLGMIVAECLGADAVVVPISCNDAVDRMPALEGKVEPKTRIGSPFVIAGMEKARLRGRHKICGWEANGGFLTGSDFELEGRHLRALPTRDAMLPILSVLFAAHDRGLPLSAMLDRLPKRFSRAALLRQFPRATGLKLIAQYAPPQPRVKEVVFSQERIFACDEDQQELILPEPEIQVLWSHRNQLSTVFNSPRGFNEIAKINYIDGLRLFFKGGDVAHVRPSGNADELRIYAVADSQERADEIARLGVAEPEGLLRQLERGLKP